MEMLRFIRVIAILEGVSYLLLFGLTMPLKYWADIGMPNKVVGLAHGILFILFVFLAGYICVKQRWGLGRFAILFISSLLPFGTFFTDYKYLRPLDV
jgi:integral membrane protein